MTERTIPADQKEEFQVFPIAEFDETKMRPVTNWSVVFPRYQIEPGTKWIFHFNGDYSRPALTVSRENNRVELTTPNLPRVVLIISGVTSFAVGTSGIGLPNEEQAVKFFDGKGGFLEIRNGGFVLGEGVSAVFIPIPSEPRT